MGFFVNDAKDKVVEDIMDQLQKWYVKQIHNKVTEAGITTSTIQG